MTIRSWPNDQTASPSDETPGDFARPFPLENQVLALPGAQRRGDVELGGGRAHVVRRHGAH